MFRHILIDEMQDTNTVQVALVETIAARGAGQPHGRRRRRPVDLPVPGRQLRQHPQVPRAAPRRPRLPARDQLPLDPRDRRLHQRLDRAQRLGLRQDARLGPADRGPARWSSPRPTPTRRPTSSASRSSSATSRGSPLNRMAVLYRNHHDSILLQGELVARGSPTRSGAACGSSSRRTSRTSWPTCGSWSTRATSRPGGGCCCSCPGSARRRRRPLCGPPDRGRRPARGAGDGRDDGARPGQEQGVLRRVRRRPPEDPGDRARDRTRRRRSARSSRAAIPATVRGKYERPENRIADIEQLAVLAAPLRQPRTDDRRAAAGRRRLRHGHRSTATTRRTSSS